MSNVSQWETSAANNDAAPPDGAPEGMAANTVNDTMREMMAATARWYQDINGSLVTGGAGNAYTLTTNNNNSSLTDLPLVVFVANRANSGASTLNVDGLGAKSLRFGGVALAAGVIQEDVAYIAIYNAEDDAFDIVGSPTRDASQITTGTLPDARLSSNVPLKNVLNLFSTQEPIIGSHPADTRIRRADTTGALFLMSSPLNDPTSGALINLYGADHPTQPGSLNMLAGDGGAVVIGADGSVTIDASLIIQDGNTSISGNLAVGGTITGNGSGLSSLSADNLSSGTVPGARLGGNQTMAGNKTFLGEVRAGTVATSTSTTLEAGQIHHLSANTTVPSMSAGQWVAVQNTSTSSITLSEGSGVTLELGGTTTTGNRTLAAKGFAFVYFRANGVGVCGGAGVS